MQTLGVHAVVQRTAAFLGYRASHLIADAVASDVSELLDLPALVQEFGFRDEKQALVIAYHELMWDLMDRFEAEGLIRKPVAFSCPDRAAPADIADLVFIVREAR